MKSHKINFWLFFIFMFPANSQSSEPIELTLSYQINPSPPYQMGTGEEVVDPPGIALDVINATAQELNLKIVYKRYPNVRVLHLLENGQIDGAFMFSYKPERARIARYPLTPEGKLDSSKRLATLSYWLYFLSEEDVAWDGKNLIGVNGFIVAEHGDSIISDLEKIGQVVQQPDSAYKALLMLAKRPQVVGAALQDVKATPLLERAEFSEIKRSSVPLKTKDYFLVLSNRFVARYPDLAATLWEKIEERRDDVAKESMHRYSTVK